MTLSLMAIIEGIVASILIAIVWILDNFLLISDQDRLLAFLISFAIIMYPIKYRKNEGRWVKIPYIFVGFCELAIVIFDRFKK